MRRQRERLQPLLEARSEATRHVLASLRERGPLGSRDFEGRERVPGGFSTLKDTGQALYRLWRGGWIMTHGRRGFDRVYDLFERVADCDFETTGVTEEAAERYFAQKALRDLGLATPAEWARRVTVLLHRRVTAAEARTRLTAFAAEGIAGGALLAGSSEPVYFPAEDLSLLHTLEAGEIPAEWKPLDTTTDQEVTFLAPLDNVIWDRARTKSLFDFTYVWEVYKPAARRQWGYYTLPVLWRDSLVARLAPKLDRKTHTLRVEGIWLENAALAEDRAFQAALAAGLHRFARFHRAEHLDMSAVVPSPLRKTLLRLMPRL
jgi:uncharacterized protein YcaQ